VFGDRIGTVQVLGIAISMSGVLAVVTRGRFEALLHLELNWGDVLAVVNMGVWAVYSACLRLRPNTHWLSFILVLAVISVAGTTPFFAWEMVFRIPVQGDMADCIHARLRLNFSQHHRLCVLEPRGRARGLEPGGAVPASGPALRRLAREHVSRRDVDALSRDRVRADSCRRLARHAQAARELDTAS